MGRRLARPSAEVSRNAAVGKVPSTPEKWGDVERSVVIQLALLLGSAGVLAQSGDAPAFLGHGTVRDLFAVTMSFGWLAVLAWGLWCLAAIGLAWHVISMVARRAPAVARGLEALALVALLACLATVLDRSVGPPHLPSHLPSALEIQLALQSPDALPPWAINLLGLLGWAFWLWVAATLLMQVALAAAETLTHGARWVLAVRGIADRVTLPIIRRLAHQAVVAVTVLQLASRVTPAAAASLPASAAALVAQRPEAATGSGALGALMNNQAPIRTTTVTVRPDDNLWVLAERFYGDGEQWPKIYAANVGRPMLDGATFPRTGVIQSGWVLRIPEPTASPPPATTAKRTVYVVQPGDKLRTIARRYYGDEMAWPRIFDANRGAHLPDGRTLTDPDLIWPGLRLAIPGVAAAAPATPIAVARPAPAAASPPTARAPVPPPPPSVHVAPARPAVPALPATPPPAHTPPPALPAPTGADAVATVAPIVTPPTRPLASTPAPTAPLAPAARPPTLPPPLFAPGAAGLAGALAGAGVLLLARRRFRTSLAERAIPPDDDAGVVIRDGYADAAHAPTFAGSLDSGTEPAVLVAEQVLTWLTAEGLDEVALLTVGEGRHRMQLTFQAGLAAQDRLLALAPDLAERLGAKGDAVRTADHDVLLRLRNLTLLRLAARPRPGAIPPLPLVALGVLPDGAVLHADWRRLGNVLISGPPGGGSDVVLASLLTALAARCHPDHLRLWIIAPRATFPAPLLDLPHGCDRGVDPGDERGVGVTIAAVRAELERRMNARRWQGPAADEPELVLVVSECSDLPDDGLLAVLGRHGPAYGMRLVAATTRPESLAETLLESCETRLVLRTVDEVTSRRLLGRPDAADLGGGGDLWARIADRVPVRLCGVRVEPDHLDRLVDRMHAAFADTVPPTVYPDAVVDRPANVQESALVGAPVAPEDSAPVKTAAPVAVPAQASASDDATAGPVSTAAPGSTPEQGGDDGAPVASEAVPRASSNGVVHPPGPAVDPSPVAHATSGTAGSAPVQAAAACRPDTGATRVQVYCFGDLRVASGNQTLSAQGQQMSWELLVFLALHEPGTVAKEDVLATLWPGTDPADAGPRIRMAMQRLRKVLAAQVPQLPSEVVRIEREGVCRLDPALVWSDAQQLLACSSAARRAAGPEERIALLEQAHRIAQQELFKQVGFRWLEQRRRGTSIRQRFRDLDIEVTSDLARCYAETGQPEHAVPLYRELLAAEPTVQEVARELYRCYGTLGARTALLEAHEQLTEALVWRRRQAEQAGHPPMGSRLEAATVATYEEVLARLDAAVSASTGT